LLEGSIALPTGVRAFTLLEISILPNNIIPTKKNIKSIFTQLKLAIQVLSVLTPE